MEKSVRQQILSASSFTTALAMAVPSYVAVPLPAKTHKLIRRHARTQTRPTVNASKLAQFVQEHEGVLGGVAQDAGSLAELHKESTLS